MSLPPDRPSRGAPTRAALLDAAIEVFGRDGFAAATVKAIASQAGANPALISYYFGGKEALYGACFEHIAGRIGERVAPIVTGVEESTRDLRSRYSSAETRLLAFNGLMRIIEALIQVLTSDESAPWAQLIVREQQKPTQAFEILYERMQGRLLERVVPLVAASRGRMAPNGDDRLTVLMLFGEILVFRAARAAALRFLGWQTIDDAARAHIGGVLRAHAAAILAIDPSSPNPADPSFPNRNVE